MTMKRGPRDPELARMMLGAALLKLVQPNAWTPVRDAVTAQGLVTPFMSLTACAWSLPGAIAAAGVELGLIVAHRDSLPGDFTLVRRACHWIAACFEPPEVRWKERDGRIVRDTAMWLPIHRPLIDFETAPGRTQSHVVELGERALHLADIELAHQAERLA